MQLTISFDILPDISLCNVQILIAGFCLVATGHRRDDILILTTDACAPYDG
jgi:hypothetical protein